MMRLTESQYERIKDILPRQRGNVRQSSLDVLNAYCMSLKMAAIGNWNTIYVRLSRWARNGVLDRIFEALQKERLLKMKIEVASLDSTIVKVHPDGTGALKKPVRNLSANPEEDGQPKFIWLPRMPTLR